MLSNHPISQIESNAIGETSYATVSPLKNLGSLSGDQTPNSGDHQLSILAAWTALEVLSPHKLAVGKHLVADFTGGSVPWATRERAPKNKKLYYQIILGSILMAPATAALIEAFREDEEYRDYSKRKDEKAVIAAILVDENGIVLESNAIAISSFAWALPQVLQTPRPNLESLGTWTRQERTILDGLEKIVRRYDGLEPIPLDRPTIDRAYAWLVDEKLQLRSDFVEAPSIAVRVYHPYRSKSPPEVSLLNSFYLTDLDKAAKLVAAREGGEGLRRYLRVDRDPLADATEIFPPSKAIDPYVTPLNMPSVRWPHPDGHPLVLLQQAAVNAARFELKNAPGIIGINGPPGTGKTTLLRDLVAACIFDRAAAMAAFADPNLAFSKTDHKMDVENGRFDFYELHETLRGHEILVASSNNNAVENITRELPGKDASGRDFRYFRSISNIVANPKKHGITEDRAPTEEDDRTSSQETWGLIAAALGNSANRSRFQEAFWWHENGFKTYLKWAFRNRESGNIPEQEPDVVLKEEPPLSAGEAKERWTKARNRFCALRDEIDADLQALENDRQECLRLPVDERDLQKLETDHAFAAKRVVALSEEHQQRLAEDEALKIALGMRFDFRRQHQIGKPGFFSQLVKTDAWRVWKAEDEELAADVRGMQRNLKAAEKARDQRAAELESAATQLQKLDDGLAKQRVIVRTREQKVSQIRLRPEKRILDEDFFASGHVAVQKTAPWVPDGLHRKREDLFAASLDLHKAFIDAAAQKIFHNIGALMNAFTAGVLRDEKKDLLGDLWSTLFLAVPVISTTFASVSRMLGDLPSESLGWLLIDEAGQALPQAAVGAIMRAKRTIAVGDPMQIQPVVSLPEKLNAEICSYFNIDKPLWAGPTASTQTLADRASRVRSTFQSDCGERHVGLPLLVHRRCQEPMFSISNAIAYDNQMVHQVKAKDPGKVGRLLGDSCWFDIEGEAQSKWCPAEGDFIAGKLIELARHGIKNPDLFIISPFNDVAGEMEQRLEDESELVSRWYKDRIGTIHTFQGREAETVILLLGSPNASDAKQSGARKWAASEPNILNVAVSRAKQNFYVVGSHRAWSGVGYFSKLKCLPVKPVKIEDVIRKNSMASKPSQIRQTPTLNASQRETVIEPKTDKVFVVHGHDEAAYEGVARFLERLELQAIVLREQADKGRTIIEKFEHYAQEVGFAVVLLTPDDVAGSKAEPGSAARARQNVIFELGYFAGKLGRGRVCLLCKGDVEIPSDLYGVIYTRMDDGRGWQINLIRELKAAGFNIDANRAA